MKCPLCESGYFCEVHDRPLPSQPKDGDVLYGNGMSGPDRRRYPRTLVGTPTEELRAEQYIL